MGFRWKQICAWILALALALSLLPGGFPVAQAAQTLTDDDYARADRVFEAIADMEAAPAKRNATQTQKTNAAIKIVEASDSYAEGSLERNGDVFTWWTEDGIRCMYNPRMQKLRENMKPENMVSQAVNEPTATRGGTPSGKQVYLIGPYYGADENFGAQYRIEAREVAQAIGDTDGYTLYSGKAATIDKVAEAVSNGAVVFFDSHGTTDYQSNTDAEDYVTGATTSYMCLSTQEGLTSADYNLGALYGHGGDAYVNGAVIASHMKKESPNGIVWMAICLGMATDGMYKPLRNKGVEVVCGYSQSVSFDGDYLYEETFWDEMKSGKTVAQAAATMKETWGEWDLSDKMFDGYYDSYSNIAEARQNYAAFPVVVSDEDTHPGKRTASRYSTAGDFGADSLQTVRSTYTLGQVYPVTDPTDPKVILEEAYALYSGEQLPYEATLTGTVVKVVRAYNELYGNVTVNMKIPGYEDKPIRCNYLVGDGVDRIGAGDTITVKGFIVNNASGGVGFDRDCVLLSWEDGDIEIDIPLNPPADPIALTNVNIALNSSLDISFNGLASVLDQYENVYVVFEAEGKQTAVVSDYFVTGEGENTRYNFTFKGLNILDMSLTIKATIHGTFNGKEYVGETKEYSLLKYATTALSNEEVARRRGVAKVCANLLQYAIAAEAYKPEAAAENLVKDLLTEEQRTNMNDLTLATDTVTLGENKDLVNGTQVKFTGQALEMLARITLRFNFKIDDAQVSPSQVTCTVSYTDEDGQPKQQNYTLDQLKKDGDVYIVEFSDFNATQMRERVTCTLYIDGVAHATYANSIENYCYVTVRDQNPDKLKTLVKRICLYGDACDEFFNG